MFISRALVQSLRVFGLAASVLLKQTPLGDGVSIVSPGAVLFARFFHCSQTLNSHYIEYQVPFLVRCPCTCHLVGLAQTASAFAAAEITDGQGDPEIS